MLKIENMEEWTKNYFASPEIQDKAKKACERYDRLMVINVKKQLSMGSEQINIEEIAAEDPGKRLEKVRFEILPNAESDGKKGKVKIDLIDQKAEFIPR